MNKHNRNTVLYSFLTISLVASYWLVRQDAQQFDVTASGASLIEINEQASEGFELNARPSTVLVSQYSQ